jgi:hypothetical protein
VISPEIPNVIIFNNLVGELNPLNILERSAQGMPAMTEWARECCSDQSNETGHSFFFMWSAVGGYFFIRVPVISNVRVEVFGKGLFRAIPTTFYELELVLRVSSETLRFFIPSRERYLQLPGGYLSIFKEEFVEIAHAEKQQGVRILLLGCRVLAHQGRGGCIGGWSWRKSRHGKRQHIVMTCRRSKVEENGGGRRLRRRFGVPHSHERRIRAA